jgi:hypothetical protein
LLVLPPDWYTSAPWKSFVCRMVKLTGATGAAAGAARTEENWEKSSTSVTSTVSARQVLCLLMTNSSSRIYEKECYFVVGHWSV